MRRRAERCPPPYTHYLDRIADGGGNQSIRRPIDRRRLRQLPVLKDEAGVHTISNSDPQVVDTDREARLRSPRIQIDQPTLAAQDGMDHFIALQRS